MLQFKFTFVLFLPHQYGLLQHLCDVQGNSFDPESTQNKNSKKRLIQFVFMAMKTLKGYE